MLRIRSTRHVIPISIAILVLVLPVSNISFAQREDLFTAQTSFAILSGPWDIAAGHLNGDGFLDLATANRNSGSVGVALHSGLGGYENTWNYATGLKPWELDLADLDGDGDEDIAVTLTGFEVTGPPADDYDFVAVLFNDGSGSFSGLTRYPIGNEPRTVFLADLGEDGNNDVDIITANEQTTSSVSVLFNDGFGNFSSATNYSLGTTPRSMCVADLNGDGFNDAVTANKDDDNITILFNDGSGSFGNFTDIDVGSGAWDVFADDISGNAAKDIIVLNRYDSTVEIQENDGTGNFSFRAQYFIWNNNSVYLQVGDADLDGHKDIMCSSMGDDLLTILFYNTTSSSYDVIQRTVFGGPRSFVLADLDIGKLGFMNIAIASVEGNVVSILLSDTLPSVTILEPDGVDDIVDFEFRIEWEDYDPDSNAIVHLYYYRAGAPSQTTSLGSFFEDESIDFLVWNVSSIDEGEYFIRIDISDDHETVTVISDGPITVEHPEPEITEDTNPSLGLIIAGIVGAALIILLLYLMIRRKPEPTEEPPIEEAVQVQSSDGISGRT
jgi:hypothetical protein